MQSMDDKRVADYFVIAGLPNNPSPLEEFAQDGTNPKNAQSLVPITDIAVIIRSQGEMVPRGYTCIETTPFSFPADLNHGSLRSPNIYLCYRRGKDKPPLVDIGVLYEGKERVMADSEVVLTTPNGRSANVNNSGSRTFLTYRRAPDNAPCNQLVVTDICVILANKGEPPPHAFCKINKNLNKGMVGSDVFICYKKSMNRPNLLYYKPAILGRYPLEDYENFPLPLSVPLFCLPMGATIECWPKKAQQPKPVFSTFVLTSDTAEKVYGAAVTFYEKYPVNKLTSSQRSHLAFTAEEDKWKKSVHANKSICILSRWPFFDTFEKFLRYLHRMSIGGPHRVPIERYISHFMLDVPFPSPQRPRILIQLADDTVSLAQPEDTPLPLSGASFIQLLRNLGPDNCLNILMYALTEQKILFHSLRPDVLTSVAEAVVMLIFPFHWQCPYIPLCPLGLSDVLSAPLPFIVGVDSRYFDLYDPPSDVTCVDLDTNSIFVSEEKRGLNIKLLPKRPGRILRNTLQTLYEKIHRLPATRSLSTKGNPLNSTPLDHDFKVKKKEHQLELEIQEAFLRFMASILKGFCTFLLPITKAPTVGTTDPSSLFDLQGFLKSRDKTYHRFFVMLMKTQMFIRFIEERSFVSDKDASLAFFDECTEKIDSADNSEPRLLEIDESHQSDRTVFIAPPEPIGLPPGVEYNYREFGTLRPQLFHRHPSKTLLNTVAHTSPPPTSPLARRTKQEIKSAQKIAKKQSETPMMWAKCLVGYCYSLWFIHLPSFVKSSASKSKALRTAYDVLVRLQSLRLHPPDEVCYRVLMLLCGLYSQPVLAVKVLFEMKRHGVQPNAITYGYYNKAVLESKWPSADSSSILLWNKLRNVIIGIAQFRQGVKKKARRSLSLCSELDYDRISRTSTESSNPEELSTIITSQPTEFVSDLIKVDDQSSSGGLSDGGYSSLNQEEGQKVSPRLDQTSLAMKTECNERSNDEEGQINFVVPTKPLPQDSHDTKGRGMLPNLRFGEVDFSASDAFRSRVGSIVRSSASSLGSLTHFHNSSVDSSAGVLMTSHTALLEDSVFDDDAQPDALRRRHKSAGDPHHKTNKHYRLRHNSGPLTKVLTEAESPPPFFRSYSFGNDFQIIRKIREAKKQEALYSLDSNRNSIQGNVPLTKNMSPKKPEENGILCNAFGLTRCEEESETELEAEGTLCPVTSTILPRPRSPNIPIKKKEGHSNTHQNLINENDSFTSGDVNASSSTNTSANVTPRDKDILPTSLSPLKEAWLNWDFFTSTNFPRKASNVSNNLGRSGNVNETLSSSSTGGAKVTRSSTFHGGSNTVIIPPKQSYHNDDMQTLELEHNKKTLSRSSTLPVPPRPKTNAKSSGTRTPGRPFSTSSSSFALPRFTSKHSEVLLDSLKSAASSVASKLSEFRQSLSASNTPTKGMYNSLPKPFEMERLLLYDDDDRSSTMSEGHRTSLDYLTGVCRNDDVFDSPGVEHMIKEPNWTRREQSNSLPHVGSAPAFSSQVYEMLESHYDNSSEKSSPRIALDISMMCCSKCYTCSSLLFDEEIMEGWSADDSNLNTQCTFCKAKFVPLLTTIIRDYRTDNSNDPLLTPAHSSESVQSAPLISNVLSRDSSIPGTTPPKSSLPTDKNSTQNSSMDSGNEAFILLEDSPDSVSLASDSRSGTPYGSPQKHSKLNQQRYNGTEFMSAMEPHFPLLSKSSFNKTGDLIKLDSPQTTTAPSLNLNETCNSVQANGDVFHYKQLASRTCEEDESENKKEQSSSCPSRNSLGSLLDNSDFILPSSATPKPSLPVQRSLSAHSSGGDMRRLGMSDVPHTLEPITVPYLSPLVLRKEVENVLDHEGDNCLTKPEFVDQHPIIYWNLVWFFKRINVPCHLPVLSLQAMTVTKGKPIPEAWQKADSRNIAIHCLWDNVKLHEDMGQPMYVLWSQNGHQSSLVHALVTDERKASKNFMRQLLAKIQCNDLVSPINMLINERRKWHLAKGKHHSIYREILFLSLVALGRENIDHSAFDMQYRKAYDVLSEKQLSQMIKCDKPPSLGAIFCRRYFKELDLKPF